MNKQLNHPRSTYNINRLIFLFIILSFSLWAKAVPEDIAVVAAKNFYSARVNQSSNDIIIKNINHIYHEEDILIYVIGIEPTGFVMLSGDDRLLPIIGYSTESGYSSENIPTQLLGLIDEYKREIIFARSDDVQTNNQINSRWDSILSGSYDYPTTRNVGPLIQARFNQPSPWNLLCPYDQDGPGGHALVGCVAVSMVQVMHYWSYPEVGNGSHGYNHGQYGYLFADFSEAFYDFDSMSDFVATSSSQLLLSHAGIAIDMGYGPSGSGAWVGTHYPNAMSAMEEHFLYKSSIHFEEKNDYSNSNWIDTMQEELDSGRPMIYRGYDNGGGGGHAWNIDGYNDEYFHCNWGWGGSYDGYFLLSNLSAGGYTFGQGQAAVMGIEPLSLSEPNIVLMDSYFVETVGDGDGVVNPGEELDIFVTIQNLIPWPTASNITMTLTTEESSISILDNSDFIETLATDNSYTNTSVPFRAIVSSDALLRDYDFQLNITADSEENDFYENSFNFEINISLNQAHFPVLVDNQLTATPVVIDLDSDDSEKEILIAENWGSVKVIDKNGNTLTDWQYDFGDQLWGTPAIGDLNGNGENEIVLTSKSGKAVILDSYGNELMVYYANQYLMGTPSIGNLDGDTDLEIVFGGYSPSGKIFAVNLDGSDVNGFPVTLSQRILSGVALADLNDNDVDDIICATQEGNIYLIHDNASIASGFPVVTNSTIKTSPSVILSDIDEPLIVVGSKNDNFYGINADGSIRFIINTDGDIMTSPAIHFGLNGETMISFGSNDDNLYLVDSYGNFFDGWPKNLNSNVLVSPIFSDLDGDGNPEIISGAGNQLFAFDMDGSSLDYFPMSFTFPFTSSLMVDDLDMDGDVEIVGGSSNDLVVVDIKAGQVNMDDWNMYRGNLFRNGLYRAQSNMANISVNTNMGWNLIGIPVMVSDSYYLNIFNSAIINTLYGFENNAYVLTDEMIEGNGYWLRFPSIEETSVTGYQISSLNVQVDNGWNLITGISDNVNVNDLLFNNELIIPNTLFYYDEGYLPAEAIVPGKGYWLKTTDEGMITVGGYLHTNRAISSNQSLENLSTLEINGIRLYFGELFDESSLNQYDLPPKPPEGGFDVRFEDNSRLSSSDSRIQIMNPDKILKVKFDVKDLNSSWKIFCSASNQEFLLSGKGNFVVLGDITQFDLKRTETIGVPNLFAFHPAFPNPFNSTTNIAYELPIGANIKIKIFDILGNEIELLESSYKEPGFYDIEWDGKNNSGGNVETGVYLFRVEAGYFSKTRKVLLIK